MKTWVIPDRIARHRDVWWRRDGPPLHSVAEAEQFIANAGFISCLTDSRQPGPSLYVAVCARRDAVMPRNVQKDPESSHTWILKDELLRRGRVYYGKLIRGKSTFIAKPLVPAFRVVVGVRRKDERQVLSADAQRVLCVLRSEWEMATAELKVESGVADRQRFTRAIDELQAAMIVIPNDVVYDPKFTYLWGLVDERFPAAMGSRVTRGAALREIARAFLRGAGMTFPGELARVTGLSRAEAGLGNHALVDEGFAVRISPGTYRLATLDPAGDDADPS